MTAVTLPGLHRDMTAATYHADPVPGGSLSVTRAKTLLTEGGPAKYRHLADHRQPPRDSFDFGHAAHKLVLGEGETLVEIDAPDWRTRSAREARDSAREAGHVPLLSADMRRVEDMAAALAAHPLAVESLAGQREVSLFWRHESGVALRSRLDVMGEGWTSDYKSCADASTEGFTRAVWRYGYHMQAAWYRRMRGWVTGELLPYRLVAQEKTAPYLVSVWEPSLDYLHLGEADMDEAIRIYAECVTTGMWPGYPHEVQTLTPPEWAYDDDIDITED